MRLESHLHWDRWVVIRFSFVVVEIRCIDVLLPMTYYSYVLYYVLNPVYILVIPLPVTFVQCYLASLPISQNTSRHTASCHANPHTNTISQFELPSTTIKLTSSL